MNTVKKWILFVFSLLLIITGFIFAFFGDHQALWAALFFGIFLQFLLHIDHFESFRLSPQSFVAKTRDMVKKAENTLSELQILAQYVAEISLSLVKRQGRLGGYEDYEKEEIKDKILEILKKIGTDEKTLQNVLLEWHEIDDFDYVYHILGGATIPATQAADKISKWRSLRSDSFKNIPSPETLRQFLNDTGLTNEGIKDHLEDYEYYKNFRKHRRPEVWHNRRNWGNLKEKT